MSDGTADPARARRADTSLVRQDPCGALPVPCAGVGYQRDHTSLALRRGVARIAAGAVAPAASLPRGAGLGRRLDVGRVLAGPLAVGAIALGGDVRQARLDLAIGGDVGVVVVGR